MTSEEERDAFNDLLRAEYGFGIGDVVRCVRFKLTDRGHAEVDDGLRYVVKLGYPGDITVFWVRYVEAGRAVGRAYREKFERLKPVENGILLQMVFKPPTTKKVSKKKCV